MIPMPQWVTDLVTKVTDEDRRPVETEFNVGRDEELGDVPGELQSLFCLRRVITRRISERQLEYHQVCGRQDGWSSQGYLDEVTLLIEQYNMLNRFFWFSLRTHFSIREGFVGLRSGWKAVRCPEQDPEESDITHYDSAGIVFVGG